MGESIDGGEESVGWLCTTGTCFAVASTSGLTRPTTPLPDVRDLPEETELSSDELSEWSLVGEGGGGVVVFLTISKTLSPDSEDAETLDSSVLTRFRKALGGELSKSLSERLPEILTCASASAWASSSRLSFAVLLISLIKIAYRILPFEYLGAQLAFSSTSS